MPTDPVDPEDAKYFDTFVPVTELSGFSGRKDKRVMVLGDGELVGAVIEDWTVNLLHISRPRWPEWKPRFLLNADRIITRFRDCVFRGVRCHNFDPGPARFESCHFDGVRLNFRPVMNEAHFVNCTFSGYLEANFTIHRGIHNPTRAIELRGNDFRGVDGPVDFFEMSEEQRFDEGGKHVVIRRADADAAQVAQVLQLDDGARAYVSRVWGPRAPQEWALVTQWSFHDPEVWRRLKSIRQS